MADISIIGTGCLIVALVVAAGIVIWQGRQIVWLKLDIDDYRDAYFAAVDRLSPLVAAEAKRQAQRIAAAKRAGEASHARALAKKAGK